MREKEELIRYLRSRGIDNESGGHEGPFVLITPEKRNEIVAVLSAVPSRELPAVNAGGDMSEIEAGQYWRHNGRGDCYLIVAVGCTIQCSALPIVESGALGEWVAYRRQDGAGSLIFRPTIEFLDGRFYRVP